MNWYVRLKAMKDYLKWDNKYIAEVIGNTPDSVKSVTSPSKGSIPRWLKLAIVVFETMLPIIKKLELKNDYYKGINDLKSNKDGQ